MQTNLYLRFWKMNSLPLVNLPVILTLTSSWRSGWGVLTVNSAGELTDTSLTPGPLTDTRVGSMEEVWWRVWSWWGEWSIEVSTEVWWWWWEDRSMEVWCRAEESAEVWWREVWWCGEWFTELWWYEGEADCRRWLTASGTSTEVLLELRSVGITRKQIVNLSTKLHM